MTKNQSPHLFLSIWDVAKNKLGDKLKNIRENIFLKDH